MPRQIEGLRKECIRLNVDDSLLLKRVYGAVGFNAAIRSILAAHCKVLRERIGVSVPQLSTIEGETDACHSLMNSWSATRLR